MSGPYGPGWTPPRREVQERPAARSDDEATPVHWLNAYTWAGRRGECGITSEWLDAERTDRNRVTCLRCLRALDAAS